MAGGPIHKNYTTDDLHIAGYIAASDPGAVGAGLFWIDTSTSPATLKKRNSGDSGWDGLQVQSATLASIADQTLLGNVSGGSAAPSALSASQVRTLLGLVIGTNVQAQSAVLAALASVMSSTATAAAQRAAIGANGYDIGFFTPGVPTASQLCLLYNAPRSIVLPASLTGSVGKAVTAATAQTDFDIQVNGVSKGTIRFAASGTVPTYIFASPVTLAAADILTIIAPGSPDATLKDIGVTLLGTY